MGKRLAVGVGVATGTVLLVAGVGSAGLVGLHGAPPPDVVVTSTPAATATSARPTQPAPTSPAVRPLPAEVVLAQHMLDPADLPVRAVDRAAVVVQVHDEAAGTVLLGLDADTAQWVRLELPGEGQGTSIHLSPDGRAVLRLQYTPETLVTAEVVELATEDVRALPVPLPEGRVAGDCRADDAAWASNGRVGIVSGCLVPNPATGAGYAYVDTDTWVHEIDLATGGARVVEHVPSSAPLENSPAYSPDGRFLVYGVGYGIREGEDEEWETLRVIQVDGSGVPRERYMTHIVRGDPWADARRVLGWDDVAELGAPDSHVLVDARTGGTAPLGVEGIWDARGFVGGRLVTQEGPWSPGTAPVTLAAVDLESGTVWPWLAVPEGLELGEVSVARELVTP